MTHLSPRTRSLAAAASLVALAAVQVRAAATLNPRDLGVPRGFAGAMAIAINERGALCGHAYKDDHTFPFFWQNNRFTVLPLGGAANGYPEGMNDAGAVVGSVSSADGHSAQAAMWSKGRLTRLPGLPRSTYSWAQSINNSALIVGASRGADNQYHAVLWQKGKIRSLGALPGDDFSQASAVNNAGVVGGTSMKPGAQESHAFTWSKGRMTRLPLPEGGQYAGVRAINARNEVLGTSGSPNGTLMVIWRKGQPKAFTPPDGFDTLYGLDLNDKGQILSMANGPAGSHLILWTNDQPADLGSLAVNDTTNFSPHAFNGKRQVAGALATGTDRRVALLQLR